MTDLQEAADRMAAPLPAGAGATTDPAVVERRKRGREARAKVPRSSHARFEPGPARPDPVDLLESQAPSRLPDLIPIRYGRMAVSPFTFFRGAALVMASDLSTTDRTGITVQSCGDAHLLNFGGFGTPERSLVFDVNDFDETIPGPWEWDLKRLVASFAIAGRDRGLSVKERRRVNLTVGRTYRESMMRVCRQPESRRLVSAPGCRCRARPVQLADIAPLAKAGREDHRPGPARRQHEGARQAHRPREQPAPYHLRSAGAHPLDEMLPG